MVTTQMIIETWVYSLFDHLTRLLAGGIVNEKSFFFLWCVLDRASS